MQIFTKVKECKIVKSFYIQFISSRDQLSSIYQNDFVGSHTDEQQHVTKALNEGDFQVLYSAGTRGVRSIRINYVL